MPISFQSAALFWPFIVCGALCALILGILLKTGWAWSLATDIPTHRSLHTRPTPRVGGLGITPSALFGVGCVAPRLGWMVACVLILAVVCQIDDRRGLSARSRFSVQLVAALVVCIAYPLPLPHWMWPAVVVGIVWVTNLYNFMDGANGLAGGMAVIGFAAYALASVTYGPTLAGAAAAIAGAATGFLFFNWSPAKLFMGDVGSIPLGFLAAAFGVVGWSAGIWPFWFPIMVFLPFEADATVTLVRRLARGARFWEAHREHFYQRMIQMDRGSHPRTIRVWYVAMAVGALLALTMRRLTTAGENGLAIGIGVIWIAVLILIGFWVDRCWIRFNSAENNF